MRRCDVTAGRSGAAANTYTFAEDGGVQRRRLKDGSVHRVVKVYYEPAELAGRLADGGWEATVEGTRWFIYGWCSPVEGRGKR